MHSDNPLLFENKAGMSTSSVGSEEDSDCRSARLVAVWCYHSADCYYLVLTFCGFVNN